MANTSNKVRASVIVRGVKTLAEMRSLVEGKMNYPEHKGGGYYELSNGESVRGKDAALQAQEALDNPVEPKFEPEEVNETPKVKKCWACGSRKLHRKGRHLRIYCRMCGEAQ